MAENDKARTYNDEDWYRCPIPRKRLKQLMRRNDKVALRDFGLWFFLLLAAGAAVLLSWGSWLVVPALVAYGVLYASAAESRFHECIHGTPFRSRKLNELFFVMLAFMSLKNPHIWRWSHTRHHTDTIIVGRDPEIAYPRPPDLSGLVLNLLHLRAGTSELKRMFRFSLGRLSPDEMKYVPENEREKVYRHSRIQLAFLVSIASISALAGSVLPLLLIGLPTFYGSWVHHILATMQHAGLAEDLPDHRLSTRTVYVNPVVAFIYANMNYHIEHHMFPMVPFYALPELHEEMKPYCPPANRGVFAAYAEIIPALRKQLADPRYHIRRKLPEPALAG